MKRIARLLVVITITNLIALSAMADYSTPDTDLVDHLVQQAQGKCPEDRLIRLAYGQPAWGVTYETVWAWGTIKVTRGKQTATHAFLMEFLPKPPEGFDPVTIYPAKGVLAGASLDGDWPGLITTEEVGRYLPAGINADMIYFGKQLPFTCTASAECVIKEFAETMAAVGRAIGDTTIIVSECGEVTQPAFEPKKPNPPLVEPKR